MPECVPVLIITGPVGVGKTSVAGDVSTLLEDAKVPHACVDIDALRWCYPGPPNDRFRVGLAMRNLAAIWPNFQAAGARRLVIADVIESVDDLAGYAVAVPGAEITVVRLRAAVQTLHQRLRGREHGASLEWHLNRAPELAAIMDRAACEHVLIDTEGKDSTTVAQEVLERVGWLADAVRC